MTTDKTNSGGIEGNVARRLPIFSAGSPPWAQFLRSLFSVGFSGRCSKKPNRPWKNTGSGFSPGPTGNNRDRYGVLPFLVGTVATAVIALLLAFPPGLAIAIFERGFPAPNGP